MSLIPSRFLSEQSWLNDAPFSRQIPTIGSGPLPNEVLCTKGWQPKCTLNATATDTTCNTLATKWNITQQDFVNYNDNVNDGCTNLVVKQSVRVFSPWTRL